MTGISLSSFYGCLEFHCCVGEISAAGNITLAAGPLTASRIHHVANPLAGNYIRFQLKSRYAHPVRGHGVTPQSQPCQDGGPAAIQGCPNPLAMEQLHP